MKTLILNLNKTYSRSNSVIELHKFISENKESTHSWSELAGPFEGPSLPGCLTRPIWWPDDGDRKLGSSVKTGSFPSSFPTVSRRLAAKSGRGLKTEPSWCFWHRRQGLGWSVAEAMEVWRFG
ncbi:unnamed protein product [Prunus brigantina]